MEVKALHTQVVNMLINTHQWDYKRMVLIISQCLIRVPQIKKKWVEILIIIDLEIEISLKTSQFIQQLLLKNKDHRLQSLELKINEEIVVKEQKMKKEKEIHNQLMLNRIKISICRLKLKHRKIEWKIKTL